MPLKADRIVQAKHTYEKEERDMKSSLSREEARLLLQKARNCSGEQKVL